MTDQPSQPAGWYYAQGDPPGTQRYWDGAQWQGGPQPVAAPGGGGSGPGGRELASPGSRILARIIDAIMIGIVGGIIGSIIGGGNAVTGGGLGTEYDFRAALGGLVAGLIGVAYELYFTSNGGQTLAKKWLNIKIVPDAGGELDLEGAVKRYSPAILSVVAGIIPILGGLVSLVIFVVALVSLVFLFTDDQRKAVWDKIADTTVVKA